MTDTCISCGAAVPEGRQVCWACEHTGKPTGPAKIKLKPCPFCGAEAELFNGRQFRDGHAIDYFLVRCTNCKAGTRRTDYDATESIHMDAEEKAARLWNRRFNGT